MVPTNVATNRKTLTENCQRFTVGVEKLSGVMSSSVAAASKPTTAGRKPLNTDCTRCVCMYFMKSLLMSIMRMSEGSTNANVAVMLPNTAIV